MHSLGTLTVENNYIITKLNRNKRSYVLDNIYLVIPYPTLSPAIYYVGDNAESDSDRYVKELLSQGSEVITISQKELMENGLSLDDVCTIVNYLINSLSLMNLPNLKYASMGEIRDTINRLSEEGW